MKNLIIKDDTNNFDTEGLESFLAKVEKGINSTQTEASKYLSQRQRNNPYFKLVLVGTTMVLSSIGEVNASDKSIFNQPAKDETTIDTYSKLVDNPSIDYMKELYGYFFKVKSTKPEIISRIVSFESLKQNWDGYEAYPLEVDSAANAINFINHLNDNTIQQIDDVFSTPNGTISFMWSNLSGERISLEIGNSDYSYYVKFNLQPPLFFNGSKIDSKEAQRLDQYVKSL